MIGVIQEYYKKGLFFMATLVAAGFSLTPFFLFVLSAFKTEKQITDIPPQWLSAFSFASFESAIMKHQLFHYLLNSFIVAGCTTLVTLSVGALAGYALARLPKRLSKTLLMGVLTCAMFPQITIAGPIWRFLRSAGWLNQYHGLILPYVALTLPLTIWILALFFRELPEELESAARVDGCTRPGVLIRIILPLSSPGLFTAGILAFIYAWNEFFLALLIMTDPARQTLPVGIALFQGEYAIPWGEIAAASLLTTLPLIMLVLFFQKRIVAGLSAGAVKG